MKYFDASLLYNEISNRITSCANAHGLTIYWPQSNTKPSDDYLKLSFSQNFSGAPHWAQFLSEF